MSVSIPVSKENKDFFEKVFFVVSQIPKGKVTTYGAIAQYLGSKRSSRMVGWALNSSHGKSDIPAHRVVNRVGLLTGKANFSTINEMEQKLKDEGVLVKNDKIIDFEKYFWDPNNDKSIL